MDVCTLMWCIFKNNTPLFPLVYQRIHPRGMSRAEGGYYLRYAKKIYDIAFWWVFLSMYRIIMDTWTSSRWYWWKGFKWASGTVYSVSNSLLGWSANSRIKTVKEQSEKLIIKRVLIAFSKQFCLVSRETRVLSYGKTGNKKRATCFATLLQNKLNSHVERFTTHESNLSCNKSGC